jgi:hypothetical protein
MTTPLFMRDVSLTLKLTAGTRLQFNCDVHTAEVVTEPGDTVDYQTLCPTGSFSSQGKATYLLHLVAAQDWSTTGLARFLWDNDGALAEFQYQAHGAAVIPPTAAAPGMSGFVRLVAPSYGGEADSYAELDVELPCSSRPTIVTSAFPALAEADADEAAAEATEAIERAEDAAEAETAAA